MASFRYPVSGGGGSAYWGDAVANVAALPPSGAVVGECRLVLDGDDIYEWNGSAWQQITNNSADVSGPGSSTDNAVARFDGTTGKVIQNSGVIVDDSNNVTGVAALTVTGTTTLASSLTGPLKGASGVVSASAINLASAEVTGVLPVANGGTNSSTALNNNRVMQSSSGAVVEAAAITANRALVSDANGIPTHATTTATEIGYVNGVTSAIQTQLDAKVDLAGDTMTGLLVLSGDPSVALGAATKQYVDNISNGLKWKEPVRVATTVAGTLATSFENGDTIDGVVLATNDRILIKNQATASENGIYIVQASGAPVRSDDANAFGELNGACVFVNEGSTNADKGFAQVNTLTSLSDNQSWVQNFGANLYTADGQGIEVSSNVFSLELNGSTLSKSSSGLQVASGGITNTEVNASAGIAFSKMAALTASRAVVTDGSGVVSVATTTATEIGYVNGVTSAIQTQIDARLCATQTINVSSNVTLTNKAIHFVDTSAARTLTLPAASTGLYIVIKDTTGSASTNNITLARPGSESIEGVAANFACDYDRGSWIVISNGTNYFII